MDSENPAGQCINLTQVSWDQDPFPPSVVDGAQEHRQSRISRSPSPLSLEKPDLEKTMGGVQSASLTTFHAPPFILLCLILPHGSLSLVPRPPSSDLSFLNCSNARTPADPHSRRGTPVLRKLADNRRVFSIYPSLALLIIKHRDERRGSDLAGDMGFQRAVGYALPGCVFKFALLSFVPSPSTSYPLPLHPAPSSSRRLPPRLASPLPRTIPFIVDPFLSPPVSLTSRPLSPTSHLSRSHVPGEQGRLVLKRLRAPWGSCACHDEDEGRERGCPMSGACFRNVPEAGYFSCGRNGATEEPGSVLEMCHDTTVRAISPRPPTLRYPFKLRHKGKGFSQGEAKDFKLSKAVGHAPVFLDGLVFVS
ncbi:hypothetical protein K438DRAFT_1975148 [Mycena galopus ATCC 62051]|nr:hypothetical protein K438DRAFT_1975148 [Mycena galopus ATCC 62051]